MNALRKRVHLGLVVVVVAAAVVAQRVADQPRALRVRLVPGELRVAARQCAAFEALRLVPLQVHAAQGGALAQSRLLIREEVRRGPEDTHTRVENRKKLLVLCM